MKRNIDIINETLRLAGVPVFEEAESPAFEKGDVKVVKPTQSKGWKEVSTSDIKDKASEKGEKSGLPEFKFTDEASLTKATKNTESKSSSESPATKGDAPKASKVEEKTEAPKAEKSEAPKAEEKKEEPKTEEKEEKKEEKKEKVDESVEKEIDEVCKLAGC